MSKKRSVDEVEPVVGPPPDTEYGETVPFYHGEDEPVNPPDGDREPVR